MVDTTKMPEEWLKFLDRERKDCIKRPDRYKLRMRLYRQAVESIPVNQFGHNNTAYAKILVDYAKLQALTDEDEARSIFQAAKNNVKHCSLVYVAWAQFELLHDNPAKCKKLLKKGKELRAEPKYLLDIALENIACGNTQLIDEETEEHTFTELINKSISKTYCFGSQVGSDSSLDSSPEKKVCVKTEQSTESKPKSLELCHSLGKSSSKMGECLKVTSDVPEQCHSSGDKAIIQELNQSNSVLPRNTRLHSSTSSESSDDSSCTSLLRNHTVGNHGNSMNITTPQNVMATPQPSSISTATKTSELKGRRRVFKPLPFVGLPRRASKHQKQLVESPEIHNAKDIAKDNAKDSAKDSAKEEFSLALSLASLDTANDIANPKQDIGPSNCRDNSPTSSKVSKEEINDIDGVFQITEKSPKLSCDNNPVKRCVQKIQNPNNTVETLGMVPEEHRPCVDKQKTDSTQKYLGSSVSEEQHSCVNKHSVSEHNHPSVNKHSVPEEYRPSVPEEYRPSVNKHSVSEHNHPSVNKHCVPEEYLPRVPCVDKQKTDSTQKDLGSSVSEEQHPCVNKHSVPEEYRSSVPCVNKHSVSELNHSSVNKPLDPANDCLNVKPTKAAVIMPYQQPQLDRNTIPQPVFDEIQSSKPIKTYPKQSNSNSRYPSHSMTPVQQQHGSHARTRSTHQPAGHPVQSMMTPVQQHHGSHPKPLSTHQPASHHVQSMMTPVQQQQQEQHGSHTRPRSTQQSASHPATFNSGSSGILVVNGKVYHKLNLIGKGGSSKVYRVFESSVNEMFAIKYINVEDADSCVIQSYVNEITLLKRLQGHESIIKLYDWQMDEVEKVIKIVLEIGSIDLAGYLRKNPEKITIDYIKVSWKQILDSVQVVHDEGIVHSDLKPANFLLVKGNLKLIDFGIANAIQGDSTSFFRDTQIGTLNYMSPEALKDISQSSGPGEHHQPMMKIGRASDVWALGCILYLMVYGRTPFQHIVNHIQKWHCIMDSNYEIKFPDIDNLDLVDTIKGCLKRDPRERYTIPQLKNHTFLTGKTSGKVEIAVQDMENVVNCIMQLKEVHTPTTLRKITQNLLQQISTGGTFDMDSIQPPRKEVESVQPNRQPLHDNLSGSTVYETRRKNQHFSANSETDKENAVPR